MTTHSVTEQSHDQTKSRPTTTESCCACFLALGGKANPLVSESSHSLDHEHVCSPRHRSTTGDITTKRSPAVRPRSAPNEEASSNAEAAPRKAASNIYGPGVTSGGHMPKGASFVAASPASSDADAAGSEAAGGGCSDSGLGSPSPSSRTMQGVAMRCCARISASAWWHSCRLSITNSLPSPPGRKNSKTSISEVHLATAMASSATFRTGAELNESKTTLLKVW
mmetsp:Transcript_86658/g.248605  ORF Transcript_86658/g.248605 Transcript_86658/m.248605 type:complete len:224 (-) Transcript_86658:181-852(-)